MNIQAMMKQAQQMQKDMMSAKKEIDEKDFELTKSFVTIKMKGNKKITEVIINNDSLEKDDIEMLQDLITVVTNELIDMINKETEQKMGRYTQGMPGLF